MRNAGTSDAASQALALSTKAGVAVSPARLNQPIASSALPAAPSIRAWLKQPRKSPPWAARA